MTTFNDLPAELRNMIYRLALVQAEPIDLSGSQAVSAAIVKPRLLATSRRIRDEATAIFYGANTFTAPSTLSALNFLKGLRPASVSSIHSLRLYSGFRLSIPARLRQSHMAARVNSAYRLVEQCQSSFGNESLRIDALLIPSLDERDCRDGTESWLRVRDAEEEDVWFECNVDPVAVASEVVTPRKDQ